MTRASVSRRLPIAIALFIVWAAIGLSGFGLRAGEIETLDGLISRAVVPWFVVDCAFLLAATVWLGWWRDIGLCAPAPRAWRLLVYPTLLLALVLAVAWPSTLPSSAVLLTVVVNTFLAGLSEELVFRGVLLHGLRGRFGLWPSVASVSALFGAMHLTNVLLTGNIAEASIQAAAATMTGVLFIGLRVRARSLLPGIVLHWVWDLVLSLVALPVSAEAHRAAAAQVPLAVQLGGALLFTTPGFLYGLRLLRTADVPEKSRWRVA